jgi:type IV pilus assembly protein PilB
LRTPILSGFGKPNPANLAMTSTQPHLKSSNDEENAIVKLVNRIFSQAIEDRVTDLYLEPQADSLQVKMRREGIVRPTFSPLPTNVIKPTIDYLKLVANIDRDRPAPQTGKIARATREGNIEIFVTTLPSQFGELIHAKFIYLRQPPSLAELIADRDSLNTILKLIHHDRGLILVAGGKDAGKSTTIYSCLAALNHPQKTIYTCDLFHPYQIPGVTQIKVERDARLSLLATCLEQNPDILYLGVIDSLSIAQIALKAVDRGCLVLATIDARDVGSAIERLIDLGLTPARVYAATIGVIAQRLVPQVCSECRLDYAPKIGELQQLGISAAIANKNSHYYRARSLSSAEMAAEKLAGTLCPQCQGWGYHGRIGLYEILPLTERAKSSILQGDLDAINLTLSERINITAQETGMRSFLDLAVNLFRSGQIDLVTTQHCLPPKTLLHKQLTAPDRIESGNLVESEIDRVTAAIYWQQQAKNTKTENERLLAELEKYRQQTHNFEQRLNQSRSQIEQSTRAEIALQLISIVDVIELARNSIKPQTDREAAIQKGYVMLENKILTSLREIGIQTIETQGQKFEPRYHEIVREEVSDSALAGTIIEEFKRGYIIGDRVLRLAQVTVAVSSNFL